MIEFIANLFGFVHRLFLWMPPYLYSFLATALDVAAIVLIVVIASKIIALGVNIIKNFIQ